MKHLVLYHANCTDGFGAAFAAWLKLGYDDATYVPVHYSAERDWIDWLITTAHVDSGTTVYVLDFSFDRKTTEWLCQNTQRFVWLDHHASVFKEWGEGAWPAGTPIALAGGRTAYVDADVAERIKQYSWAAHAKGGAVAYTGGGRANPRNEYMHHLILPAQDGLTVDHINRNSLDNRRCNLRYATRSQNGANMDRGSEFKGVTAHGPGFKAQITVGGKNKTIGTYPTKEEAAKAYDTEAIKQWGEYARVNFGQREPFPPTAHVVLDNNKSGAVLSWEYFHPEIPVPLMIQHIDDRDRWVFALDGTREVNASLRSREPWSFEQWEGLMEELDDRYGEGLAILRAHDQHVQSIARGAKGCWIKGPALKLPGSFLDGVVLGWDGGLVVNCPPAFTSDVGHKLAKDCGTFGLMWHTVDGIEARCSLRSEGEYDVSAIAKAFSGGGHKNAAGFSVPLSELLGWYRN